MSKPLRLVLVMGSDRPRRLCDAVAGWARAEIERLGGFSVEIVDPREPVEDEAYAGLVGGADAVLVVTPEYNHSYPAPLKALIDRLHGEWARKPVAFVSYGGVSGGLRAVEHLRHVFAELDAHGLRDTVSFANAWEQFGDDGALKRPEVARRALGQLLDRLAWWANALKAAREADPSARRAA